MAVYTACGALVDPNSIHCPMPPRDFSRWAVRLAVLPILELEMATGNADMSSSCPVIFYLASLVMKGCFNASAGVIRFSGFSARQRSNKSVNRLSSLTSASVMPFEVEKRRVRRSRLGLTNDKILTVSW